MNEEEQYEKEAQAFVRKKQRERIVRKGHRKVDLLRGTLRFLTSLFIILGIIYCLTLKGWYLPSDTFKTSNPQRVLIMNNKITKTAKIKSVIKDIKPANVPIFLLNMGDLNRKILSLASIDDIYIRRFAFPARIWIIVRESVPVLTVATDINVKPVAAFTEDGKIIEGSDYFPLPKEYKTLLVLASLNNGNNYKKWDDNKIKDIKQIAHYAEAYSKEPVEYIDLRNPDDIFVKIKSVLIRLGKNDSNIYERIKRIPTILPEAEKFKNKVDYIDIRWQNVNYIKMK